MTILDQNGKNKKKSLAFKASSQEEESDENDDREEDKDFALLMKQFNKFAKKKNFNFKGKKKSPPKCFECGEVGHIKPNCPKLQREEKDKKMKKKKQKAYMSWENEDDSSTDSDEEDEVANLCLMANIEKEITTTPFNYTDGRTDGLAVGVGTTGTGVGAEVPAAGSPRSRGMPVLFLGRPLRPVPLPRSPRVISAAIK
ncbi:hypothetical protein PIB30_061170 [Stylosanthes scabra]|uniref:CCHC-type domain-containing protein n=1 Tax=Stylosanthes scabra TaxID=79078 RepID=A0ABU6QLE8_9FABA|nr:hypothetical protein [Stylosanthes scabra]